MADGTEAIVGTNDADRHPVGSTVTLVVDGDGLRELIAEPYDATVGFVFVSAAALIGAGLCWRFTAHAAGQRRFFRRGQPASTVSIRCGHGRVYVYPHRPDDAAAPLGELPVRDDLPSTLPWESDAAVLHGIPVPGQWCTVTVRNRTLSPRYPLQRTRAAPDG